MLVNGGEFLAIKNYIGTFFQCNRCRLHFLKTTEKYDINNTNNGEQILYMWNVHNLVNLRLRGEEERDGHGDPNYPKEPWPLVNQCDKCYLELPENKKFLR
eukprot:UN18835